MPDQKFDSKRLRQLADDFLRSVAEDEEISSTERPHLITALVRQWVTYDGHAVFFFMGEDQITLIVAMTPLGNYSLNYSLIPEPTPPWVDYLLEDWQIDPDDLQWDKNRQRQPTFWATAIHLFGFRREHNPLDFPRHCQLAGMVLLGNPFPSQACGDGGQNDGQLKGWIRRAVKFVGQLPGK